MQIASYKEAVDYLESFIGKVLYKIDREYLEHHDPLERMRLLLDLLGNPQDKFQSVLVGGTSGKGSTAYLISHILTTAGYKTGLTISPHLQKLNERLQINNQPIADDNFVKLLKSSILPSIRQMSKMEIGAPSYFEIIVAMAFLYFAKEKVDIAVVEVGMGGEFDATNTLYPLVAVLTNVSLDHTNILGGTVQKIAKTKAGIIKKGKGRILHPPFPFPLHPIVVTGVKQPSVIKIVKSRCKEVGGELFRLGKDFKYRVKKENIGGSAFDLTTTHDRGLQLNNLNLSLLGRHQADNASLAIEAILQLEKLGFKVSEDSIRKALKAAFFAGRFEIIRVQGSGLMVYSKNHQRSTINHQLILDGAHNPTKMRSFIQTVKKLYPKNPKVFVIAFKSDKNIKGMLKQVLRLADEIIVTEFSGKTDTSVHASAPAESIKYEVSSMKYKSVSVEKDSKKALDKALHILISQYPNINAIIVVTGSLYLVGEVRSFLL